MPFIQSVYASSNDPKNQRSLKSWNRKHNTDSNTTWNDCAEHI